MKPADKKISATILTPVYNEESGLEAYRLNVQRFMDENQAYDFEIILVDDGSNDRSWEMISQLARADRRFCGIRLSRNFGAHTALTAGIDHAKGDILMTLACDLQDPIEVFHEFLQKWRDGAHIVWGKRRSRLDKGWRVLCSKIFFEAVRRYAMPRESQFTTGSFFLIDRSIIECVKQFREQNRITFAIVAWTGFCQATVEYDRKERISGLSGWSFGRMIKAMYDTFLGFSLAPVRLMTFLGLFLSGVSFLFLLYTLIAWLQGNPMPGWSSLMAIMTFFFGLLFFMISVIGEYLYRIYSEVVGRPLYFVSERVGIDEITV